MFSTDKSNIIFINTSNFTLIHLVVNIIPRFQPQQYFIDLCTLESV